MKKPTLILASSSPYRKALLAKLALPFHCVSPDIDETAQVNETPTALVMRLAEQKAIAAAKGEQNALVISSDQVCVINDRIVGKPRSVDNAIAQLQAASGNVVTFYTGLCVYNSQTQQATTEIELVDVRFRTLSNEEITRYIALESPLDCAGSFKSEGLGICLFESLSGRDPNALIGLPLILLCELLRQHGLDPLSAAQ